MPIVLLIALRNIWNQTPVIGNLVDIINILLDISHQTNGYEHPGSMMIILAIGFVLIWGWVCSLLIKKIPNNIGFNVLFFWSNNVTIIYFIHWVIIGWLVIFFGYQELNIILTFIMILIILFLANFATFVYSFLINYLHRITYNSICLRNF